LTVRFAALVSSMLLCSCATAETPPVAHAWPLSGYEGFVESIDAFVGPAVVDCGFFNLLEGKPTSNARHRALTCVERAIKSGQTFKYGTERLPIDSFATEVIARTADGKLWMVVFDVMVDGDAPQQWNQVCQSVAVDPRTMIIDAQGCVENSTGRLVTK
jgi:hypothetical protein